MMDAVVIRTVGVVAYTLGLAIKTPNANKMKTSIKNRCNNLIIFKKFYRLDLISPFTWQDSFFPTLVQETVAACLESPFNSL